MGCCHSGISVHSKKHKTDPMPVTDEKQQFKHNNKPPSNVSEVKVIKESKPTRQMQDFSSNSIQLRVEANTTEVMFPVWVEKGRKIKFKVMGMWSLMSGEMVNYKGHVNFKHTHRNLSIGALVGRIHGGTYFEVSDEIEIIPNISGPLYLFANNSRFSVQPCGALDVFLDGAIELSSDEIEMKLGWDLKNLNTSISNSYLQENEKSQLILLNKIRSDPRRFAEQYLFHLKGNGPAYQEIYEKLLVYPSSKILFPCKSLYLADKDHAKDIGENGTTGHISTDGKIIRDRISTYAIKPTYYGENFLLGNNDPLRIVLNLLVDEETQNRSRRVNLLNEVYDQIGISIQKHSIYKWVVVHVYGQGINDKPSLQSISNI